jgi:hypothetical protein
MKRYKIDFNNGKVFEVRYDGILFRITDACYTKHALESLGATITEIEEPRRQYWVRHGCGDSVLAYLKKHETIPTIHVVELKEGEIIVDKEKLEKAFRAYSGYHISGAQEQTYFEEFCKELGLE